MTTAEMGSLLPDGSPSAAGYSFISWDIDGALSPPAAECEAAQCGASTASGGGGGCGCAYAANRTYTHATCLTPGPHTLRLHDGLRLARCTD